MADEPDETPHRLSSAEGPGGTEGPAPAASGTVELTVDSAGSGRRLDAWLAEAIGGVPRSHAQRLIEAGQVLVEGEPRPKSHRLSGGERVSAELSLPARLAEAPAPEPRVAWEDARLAVLDKPPGLVVHPAPGHRGTTLVELLAARAGGDWTPLVVHRLDRNTSGLMLVAKDASTQRRLRESIRRREVEREYLALVKGRLGAREGAIEAPLGRDVRRRTRMSPRTSKGRPARTRFTVERFLNGFTLVRARLETGRTHQIRAHFAAIGHPLCGDVEYGGGRVLGLRRQFLHSARLALRHPWTDVRVEQSSPLPDDLGAALGRAGA